MKREIVRKSINEALSSLSKLPSESTSEKAVHTVLSELLSFCEEASYRIEEASKEPRPLRADLLISVLKDIEKDAAIVDMLLGLDPAYEDVRVLIAEGVRAFSDYTSTKLKSAIILSPSDMSIEH